ncbi:conjugal transfer mating pair stabilization protein TraN [Methylocaldum szegediense]|uniref:Conjugal transfer mating pair stabilization protein TraN n=1 Tax=Methylocaldum szegediense TaxID=73780 RepID=A0ABM9I120_9GAMM|nr:conjugal transfer mating pair stabilization protein TraN [Methylocaldum szegediense]CAI8818375.1 conjugal transfer mating pair stabilization protein TraN [Methylocaldum szegediense]
MSTSWFRRHPVFAWPLVAVLNVAVAWTPFGLAYGDAFGEAARQGQATGRAVVEDFRFPDLNEPTGALTLNPGTGQESTLPLKDLFPDSDQGNLNDLTGLYGDNAATVAAGLDAQTALKTEATHTGEAYRTVIHSARRAHPDLRKDPIWTKTEEVLDNHDLFAKTFADCTASTVFTEHEFEARLPDYKTCLRVPNPPSTCTATRNYTVSQDTVEVKLGTIGKHDVSFSFDLKNGTGTWWSDIGAGGIVEVPKLDYAKICDASAPYRIRHVKTVGWLDSGLWSNDGGFQVDDSVSQGIAQMPSCENGLVGTFWQHDVGGENWVMAAKLYFSVERVDKVEWLWSNAKCPELVNAVRDNLCSSASVSCTNDPGVYNAKLDQKCFEYNGVRICESDLPEPLLPQIPKTCGAVSINAQCDFAGGAGTCWTDSAGVHCLTPGGGGQTCEDLEAQGCAFIRSECVDGTEGETSGTCWRSSDLYDCGTTQTIPTLRGASKQTCAGPVRCMGEDCVTVDRTQSQDFVRAVAALHASQQMAMDTVCETEINEQEGQGFEFTTCQVFKGEARACKIAGGLVTLVDCCNAPTSTGLGDYIDLLFAVGQLDSAIMRLHKSDGLFAAWEKLRQPVVNVWDTVTGLYDRAVDAITGSTQAAASTVAKEGLISQFQTMLMKEVATWVGQTFGGAAGNLLFSAANGMEAFDASGQLTAAGQNGVQLGGGGAYIGTALNVIMMAYTIYMIVVIVVQIVFECEQSEYELVARKALKSCTNLGTYCEEENEFGVCFLHKESYCCFASPLARILQEQIRPQLGMSFGKKENPDCSGIPVEKLQYVDWSRVNLDEWLAILASTGHLPDVSSAAAKLNLERLTGAGSRLNVDGTRLNTLDRNRVRLDGLDVPAIRREAEEEGWALGPK